MFQNLYKYWYSVTDSPSIIFKINLWTYINIRYFKLKFTRILTYFTLSLKSLKSNEIKVLYKDWIFENFYIYSLKYVLFIIIICYFI